MEAWIIPEGSVIYTLQDVMYLKSQDPSLVFVPMQEEDYNRIVLENYRGETQD
jgi:hypothetical protein